MRPLTLTVPKALVHVAGKPILGHILDEVISYGITDVVMITGYLGDQIQRYVEENYNINATFIHQEDPLGLGHAIHLTKDAVGEEPALIIYGDTLFQADLKPHLDVSHDGAIGTLRVEDARAFGVVELHEGRVSRLVEKPPGKKPGEVIVGVNIIQNTKALFDALDKLIEEDVRTKGEYQLTDAFQLMVEEGAHFSAFPITRWYDCGNTNSILETNGEILSRKGKVIGKVNDCTIIPPVHIPEDVVLSNSIIGPNVSIGQGCVIRNATVSNSILHPNSTVENAQIEDSLLGRNATVRDFKGKLNIGDFSNIS